MSDTQSRPVITINGQKMLLISEVLMNQLHHFAGHGGTYTEGGMLSDSIIREANAEQSDRVAVLEREKAQAVHAAVAAEALKHKVADEIVKDTAAAKKPANGAALPPSPASVPA